MASAFSPVLQRSGTPRLNSFSARLPSRRASGISKRVRQSSSLAEMMLGGGQEGRQQTSSPLEQLAECSREGETSPSPVPPDHVSTSASEASESNDSQTPKMLDFIGATCQVSSWFTSCFPCTIVDINEYDDRVMDKLSRESAMNVMYAANPDLSPGANSLEADEALPTDPDDAPLFDYPGVADDYPYLLNEIDASPHMQEVDSDVIYTHLPIMTVSGTEHLHSQGSDRQLHIIQDDNEVESMSLESMSLDEMPPVVSPTSSTPRKIPNFVPTKMKNFFSMKKNKEKGAGGRPPLIRQ